MKQLLCRLTIVIVLWLTLQTISSTRAYEQQANQLAINPLIVLINLRVASRVNLKTNRTAPVESSPETMNQQKQDHNKKKSNQLAVPDHNHQLMNHIRELVINKKSKSLSFWFFNWTQPNDTQTIDEDLSEQLDLVAADRFNLLQRFHVTVQ